MVSGTTAIQRYEVLVVNLPSDYLEQHQSTILDIGHHQLCSYVEH